MGMVKVTLTLVAVMLVGCGAQERITRTVEASRDIITVSEPCLVAQQQGELASCSDDACKADVKKRWKPIADALDYVRAAWCEFSPSEECKQ